MNRDLVTFGLLGAAHSLNHSLFLVLPPLLGNIAQNLGVSFQTLGLVATATYFIYGTGALAGGPLSDIIGSVKVARISIGLAGISSLLFLICREIYTFSAAMFLMAIWASFYHPTANKLIAQAFPSKTGNAMGIHNAAGNAGQVLTPTIAFLLGVAIDWRFSFIFFGLLSIGTAYFMNRITIQDDAPSSERKIAIGEFLRIPNFWQILLFNALVGFIFRGVEVYFPTFLSLGQGYTGEFAAIGSSLILLFGVAGQLIGGRGSDKVGPTKILLGAVVGILLSLFVLLLIPTSYPVVIAFTLIYGVAVFAHQPSMTSLVSSVTPRHLMGLSYGVMFFFSFGLGSVAAFILGWLTDSYGVVFAFWSNTIVAVALLGITLLIYRTFGKTNSV
ncbi:MAG: MFS transporter [Candidatus Bathyarchaeia archaeon]|jgi:MFS family permease